MTLSSSWTDTVVPQVVSALGEADLVMQRVLFWEGWEGRPSEEAAGTGI